MEILLPRSDSWAEEQDLLLAKIVLKYIRDGKTQKDAFEEAGSQLSRTAAACSYRWNNEIKDKYESAVEIAKKTRLQMIKTGKVTVQQEEEEPIINSPFAMPQRSQKSMTSPLLAQISEVFQAYEKLKEENEALKNHIQSMESARNQMENDYKTMLEIMERTRKVGT